MTSQYSPHRIISPKWCRGEAEPCDGFRVREHDTKAIRLKKTQKGRRHVGSWSCLWVEYHISPKRSPKSTIINLNHIILNIITFSIRIYEDNLCPPRIMANPGCLCGALKIILLGEPIAVVSLQSRVQYLHSILAFLLTASTYQR